MAALGVSLGLFTGSVGCGSEAAPPVSEPRPLPGFGDPLTGGDLDGGVTPEPAPSVRARDAGAPGDASFDAGPACCDVTFAIADEEANETTAVVLGPTAPLSTGGGVNLTHADGKWSASVCMPPSYDGIYYYEFGKRVDEGSEGALFIEQRANLNAPVADSVLYGVVNRFDAFSSCAEIGATTHSDTSD